MEQDFWLGLWERGHVPFHNNAADSGLVAHLPALRLQPGARVFLPLCGQTVDIGWLRARGFRAAGAELSPLAVEQLFDSLGERPDIAEFGPLRRFRARDVEVWQGDIFDLTADMLGPVDAVHDRAALIALPPDMRARYAAHLTALTGGAPQLLGTFLRPDDSERGPPFVVTEPEIRRLYGSAYNVRLLADIDEGEGQRGQVWHLARP